MYFLSFCDKERTFSRLINVGNVDPVLVVVPMAVFTWGRWCEADKYVLMYCCDVWRPQHQHQGGVAARDNNKLTRIHGHDRHGTTSLYLLGGLGDEKSRQDPAFEHFILSGPNLLFEKVILISRTLSYTLLFIGLHISNRFPLFVQVISY